MTASLSAPRNGPYLLPRNVFFWQIISVRDFVNFFLVVSLFYVAFMIVIVVSLFLVV
jgi:hypothetical protein